ncbi:MAG: hypothetical protein NXH70_00740 [Hyphomonas sp.]|nr:hypothetical protein [Hyphomonas sp.]
MLIYGSPSDSLSYDLNERRSAARDHRSALKKWAIYHETLLKFYHKHRHKCALMHIDSFSGNDEGFATALEQKFGIELRRSLQARHLNRSAINNVIAERLCDEMLAEQALFVELNDSADMPQIQRNNGEDEWLSDMFAELQTWAETLDRAQQLERENLRQKSLIEQLEGNIEVWENSDAVADLQLTELQLRQVQEELHFYFSEYQKLQQETTFPNLSGSEYLQGHASSDALVLDLRAVVNGSGWHNSEANGRWAGDADIATLKLPTFPQVDAELRMRIVDTMSLEHLDALQVTLNGQRLNGRIIRICDVGGRLAPLRRLKAKLQKVEKPLPAELIARVSARDIAAPGVENELEIRFPKPVSPTSSGHSDARKLSVCVQTVRLSKVG